MLGHTVVDLTYYPAQIFEINSIRLVDGVQALRNLYDAKPMRVRNSIGWIAPRNQSPEQTHSSEHCVDVVEEYNRTGRQKVAEGIKIRDDSFD
jgi:hypothetical protein